MSSDYSAENPVDGSSTFVSTFWLTRFLIQELMFWLLLKIEVKAAASVKVKVKQSRYRPWAAQRVPGS